MELYRYSPSDLHYICDRCGGLMRLRPRPRYGRPAPLSLRRAKERALVFACPSCRRRVRIRGARVRDTIIACALAQGVAAFMQKMVPGPEWSGRPAKLLAAINYLTDDRLYWARLGTPTPSWFSCRLQRAAGLLLAMGIAAEFYPGIHPKIVLKRQADP